MFVVYGDTGIREAATFWFISMDGNNGRTQLFLYFYFLLIGVNIVLGKDPIVRECSYPWKISARPLTLLFPFFSFLSGMVVLFVDSHMPNRSGLVDLRVRGVEHD